jgi:protocatechuate 3,4-dioxygenase beta subunit
VVVREKLLVKFLSLTLLIFLLTACSQAGPTPAPVEPLDTVVATSTEESLPPPAATNTSQPPAASSPEPTEAPVESQPPAPLTDRERALAAFPADPQAAGEVLIVYGRVLDPNGNPLSGAAVEFWQTDASGVYDHPNDPGSATRDLNFQFFGTSIADENGMYLFRTVRPAVYGSRPPHIHLKVTLDGREQLTSQFYFVEDQAGVQSELLLLSSEATADAAGRPVLLAQKDLVIGGSGSLQATPAQGEGPYYPVVPVSEFDNDLTVTN